MEYIALDVETPNSKNDGICSIGTLLMTDDKITDEWYTLVDPEDIFEDFNISIHHIHPRDVIGAPRFEEVWSKISGYVSNRVIIAHNAEFDLTVLAKALENRRLPMPEMKYICTVNLGKRVHYNGGNVKGGIFLRLHEMYDFSSADYVRKFRYPKPSRDYRRGTLKTNNATI